MARFGRLEEVREMTGSRYPAPHAGASVPTARRRVGLAVGLTRIGVTMTRIPPGAGGASQRRWDSDEGGFFLVREVQLTSGDDERARQLAQRRYRRRGRPARPMGTGSKTMALLIASFQWPATGPMLMCARIGISV